MFELDCLDERKGPGIHAGPVEGGTARFSTYHASIDVALPPPLGHAIDKQRLITPA